jgi:hypothetical protein
MNHDMMSEAERLSLQASAAIDAGALALMRERPSLSYEAACEAFMAARPSVTAAYAGDVERYVELTGRGRSTRMATAPTERRMRRGAPPPTLASRPIRDRSELRDGETAVLKLAPAGCGGGLFAELVAA